MQGSTIDEVISSLDAIIDWAYTHDSRLGYFACLYRRVTIEVKAGIAEGFFQDGRRMEALDVIFASRYLAAVDQYWRDERPTTAWQFAFDAARTWRPVVLQHILLGMNAHINLDLGIATAQTVPPAQIEILHGDFLRINQILANMVDDTRRKLARVWPAVNPLSRVAGDVDNAMVDLILARSRNRSWQVACRLASLPAAAQPSFIDKLDAWTTRRGRLICRPSYTLSALLLLVRLRERGNVARHLDILR